MGTITSNGSRKRLEGVLNDLRTTLDAQVPEYASGAIISILPDSNVYPQPRTDYEIFVTMDEPDQGVLERIADALPMRFEKNGFIYTVHVESTEEHLERHVDALGK